MSPARIPIALIITELDFGGAEQCLVNIASGLDRTRFAVSVYGLSPPPRPPVDGLLVRLQEAGIEHHFLNLEHVWQLPQAVGGLRHLLTVQEPRVVMSFLFHANVVAAMALRGRTGTALACGIRVADPSRWRKWLEGRALRRAQRVVCVSHCVARFAASQLHVPNPQLMVIPNGVDADAFDVQTPIDLAEIGVPVGRRALTVVARLTFQKGIDALLRAAGPMLTALPDHDLVLVGQGPARRELQRLAAELGLANRVHFTGWRADVPAILKASELLLLPSRWEGMPNVLLEAMACGRAAVCTRAEGVRELLGPLFEAQTAPIENAQSTADKVVAIIQQPTLRSRLEVENRARVVRYFSRDTMIQAYQNLLLSLDPLSKTT